MRRNLVLILSAATFGLAAWPTFTTAQQADPYRTPYRVEFSVPLNDLVSDLAQTERGDPRLESEVAHAEWYARRTLDRWHAWGPPARTYPAPRGIATWPVERQRERAIAVALRYLGYGYQHHHVPDWSPPAEWPWKETCVGHNGKGVDCSNFTSFVYNQGFGIRLNGDVHRQAAERSVERSESGRKTHLKRIELPANYSERRKKLRTGDLVYIRSKQGEISHVVLWVGPIGRSPAGYPLIIDSHGEGVRDDQDQTIPCGIQLRPFRESSWYNRSASHALRVISEPED